MFLCHGLLSAYTAWMLLYLVLEISAAFPGNLGHGLWSPPPEEAEPLSVERFMALTAPITTRRWTAAELGLESEYPQQGLLHEFGQPSQSFSAWNPHSSLLQDGLPDPQAVPGKNKRKYDHLKCSSSESFSTLNPQSRHEGQSNADELQMANVPVHTEANQGQISNFFNFDPSQNLNFFTPEFGSKMDSPASNIVQDTTYLASITEINVQHKQPSAALTKNLPPPTCLGSDGRIREPLLKEFFTSFQAQLGMAKEDDGFNNNKFSYSSCIATAPREMKSYLVTLYKYLLGWTYELHENTLNHFDLPVHTYRQHHLNFYNWLRDSLSSSPSTSTTTPFFEELSRVMANRPLQGPLSPVRKILIRLFSGKGKIIGDAVQPANELLKVYLSQNKIDYAPVSQALRSIGEPVVQPEMNPGFQHTFSIISKLKLKEYIFKIRRIHSDNSDEKYRHLFPILAHFEKQFETIERIAGTVRGKEGFTVTYHPRLPIAVKISLNTSGWGVLRILNSQAKNQVMHQKIIQGRLYQLLIVTDRIHAELLKGIPLTEEGRLEARKHLIKWLIAMFFKPQGSIPIQGAIQLGEELAPWYKETSNTFGDLQVKVIHYLAISPKSDPDPDLTLRDLAAFLIASWPVAQWRVRTTPLLT